MLCFFFFFNSTSSDLQQFPIKPCHLSNSSICEDTDFFIKQIETSSAEKKKKSDLTHYLKCVSLKKHLIVQCFWTILK